MSSTSDELSSLEVVEGRGGLHIPAMESRIQGVDGTGTYEDHDVRDFFRLLTELNGYEHPKDSYGNLGDVEYDNVLIVPGNDRGKDPLIVRSRCRLNPNWQEEFDEQRRKSWRGVSARMDSKSNEDHGIFALPDTVAGPPIPQVRVYYNHLIGTSEPGLRNNPIDILPQGNQNERLQIYDMLPSTEDEPILDRRWEIAEQRYSDAIKLVIDRATALLQD